MLDFVLTTVLRVSLLLVTAWLLTTLLKRASASLRHGIWAGALLGSLVIPCLSLLPGWQVLPTLTEASRPSSGPAIITSAELPTLTPPISDLQTNSSASRLTAPELPALTPANTAIAIPWFELTLGLWALGVAVLIARIAMALQTVHQLTRNARLCTDDTCNRIFAEVLSGTNNLAAVTLLVHDVVTSPMTWGVHEPVIILPSDASSWSPERVRAVLIHECSHIARRDFVTQLAARFACAVYWFHPVAWLATYKLHLEQERACDDAVLHAGGIASSYAEDLLAITRNLHPMPRAALVSTAIARPSELVQRMRYLLDSAQTRRILSRRSRTILTLASLGLCTVVGMSRAMPPEPLLETDSAKQDLEQDPNQDPDAAARAARLVGMLDLKTHLRITTRELVKIGKPAIPALARAVGDKRLLVVQAAVAVLAKIENADDTILPLLAKALTNHPDDLTIVRACAWRLHENANNKALIGALIADLSSEDTRVNRLRLEILAKATVSTKSILLAVTPICASDTELSQLAVTVVARLDPTLRMSRNVILQALGHTRAQTVVAALTVFTRAGIKDARSRDLAKAHLKSSDPEVRNAAKRFLYVAPSPIPTPGLSPAKAVLSMPPIDERQFLIADYSKNRILAVDLQGEEQFAIEEVYGAWDAELLPNGNLLITEFALNQVVERTKSGKVVWQFDDLKNPNDADRLANGNTLIADTFGNRVIEVNPEGVIVWSYSKEIKPYDVERLPNGNTLIADGRKDRVLEVDSKGNTVWVVPYLAGIHDVDFLANGNFLITQRTLHRVIEIDRAGKLIWKIDGLASPSDADRLPDGTTVIAENGGVSIYDHEGKRIKWFKIAWAVEVNMIHVPKPSPESPPKKSK